VIVLSVLLLSALVVFMVIMLTPKRYQALQKELDHISSLGDDALSGARPIRAFNREEYEIEKFKGVSTSYRKKAFSLASINAWLNPLTYVFVNLGVILVLFLSGYHFDISGIGAGTAVAILNYLAQALTALVMFSRLVVSLSKAAASKKRVDEFLSVTPSISSGKEVGRVFEKGETIFELKGASLSYGGEEAALSKIDFILREGESVGIIGGTGSGKSSLISLLERFFDASEGEVLYLGKNIKDYCLDAYRSKIALVSQKPQLFKGTVRSNLLVANPNASEEDIEKALKDSLAAEFVNRYKDGLDHEVEEGGSNLSGGQKQRLLIARALLAGREILILDDSTSALDYKSDSLLRKNVKKRKLTLILVSQRATSVKDMDRIYVLDQGKVVAVGKHEELLSSCSIYQEIYQTQVAVK
jgi:ATP-binding cassette subfamily B protein